MMSHRILKAKRFWVVILSVPLFLWGWYWVYHNKTLGFSVAKISSNFSYDPAWATLEPQGAELDHLKEIFHQKFTYLAAGSQSYAFASEDGKYVIKFFRMKHLIPKITDYLHPDKVEHRRQNLLSIFSAHKLAYEELRQETGLIYLHLNKSRHLQTTLHVVDRLGRPHQINLDKTEFVVQEKAELIFTRLKKLLQKGDHEAVERSIAAVMELVRHRIDLGIADHDKAVTHNYGFVGERAVHLDIGRIYKEKKLKDYDRIEGRIRKWVTENSSS